MIEFAATLCLIGALILLIILAVIDLKTWLLPNKYVFPLLVLACTFHPLTSFAFVPPLNVVWGAITGGSMLYVIRFLAEKFYAPDSLGLGDVKLMGAAGAWLGPYYILVALTIGALAGIAHGLGIATHNSIKHKQRPNFKTLSLPAGPGFIIGIIATAIYVFKDFPAMVSPW